MVVATRPGSQMGSQMGSQTDRLGSTITTIPTSAPAIHIFTLAHFHTTNPFPFPFFFFFALSNSRTPIPQPAVSQLHLLPFLLKP